MAKLDEPTEEQVRSLGWNSLPAGSGNDHVFAQQLSYIGVVLVQIRELLRLLVEAGKEPGDGNG